ncbi:MAG: gliding motility-associated C-terminal domain-containing protein [Lewinellaceae bacterium]|nr:gliding motility-associated C-terminal domain-containing protein [Lewinellaceae bacterium]
MLYHRILFYLFFLTALFTATGKGYGQCWVKQVSNTSKALYDVHFVTENKGFAVGSSGVILKTLNSGNSWVVANLNLTDINDIYFLKSNPLKGWVVGKGTQNMARTSDGGNSWTDMSVAGTNPLLSICLPSVSNGWIVGGLSSASIPEMIRMSNDGGVTWNLQQGTLNSPKKTLYSVYFVNDQNGWTVGDGGVINKYPGFGSSEWLTQNSGVSSNLRDVYFINSETGWVVGWNGTCLKTTNGGQNWIKKSVPTNADLQAVYFTSLTEGWIVGKGGTILHTSNGGETWMAQSSGTNADLYGINFPVPDKGWVVGSNGTILVLESSGAISLTSNNPCVGDILNLSVGSANGEISWMGPNQFKSNNANPVIPNASSLNSGIYSVTVTNGGCVSYGSVEVNVKPLPDISASGGEIDCTTGEFELVGSSMTPNPSFEWFDQYGFPIATSSNLSVNQPGSYTLKVTADGCAHTKTVQVTGSSELPTVQLSAPVGTVLTCDHPTIELKGESNQNVSYQWKIFQDILPETSSTLTVSNLGYYTLVVTPIGGGCSNSASINIDKDMVVPVIQSIQGGILSCEEDSIQLLMDTPTPGVSFEWTGPGNYLSNAKDPFVSLPGIYILRVKGLNGCIAQQSVEVTYSGDVPDNVMAHVSDTLTCLNTSVIIEASSSTTGVNYSWQGPGGFQSSNQNNTVQEPGTYFVTVIDTTNQCKVVLSVEVVQDTSIPDMPIISLKTALCDDGLLVWKVEDLVNIQSILWMDGQNQLVSEADTILISSPGIYQVILTGINGCTISEDLVLLDTDFPEEVHYTIQKDLLDCMTGRTLLIFESDVDITSVEWLSASGVILSTADSLLVETPGQYNVHVVTDQGCDITEWVTVYPSEGGLFPTVITPDGDGKNDRLIIKPCDVTIDDEIGLQVFNRWGMILYESKDYQNDWPSDELDVLPTGQYYYLVNIGGNAIRKNLSIIK